MMTITDHKHEIHGAHHTSFTVADLERSVEFFGRQLGMEQVYRRTVETEYFAKIVGLPGCVVDVALFRVPGGTHHIELFQYLRPSEHQPAEPRPCDPGSSHLSLLVDDLISLYERLKGDGVSFVSPPVLIDTGPNRGGYGVYCRDPNGILIEFFQMPPG